MRKLLALTLALLLLAGLAACGDGETSSVPTSSTVGESSTPSEPGSTTDTTTVPTSEVTTTPSTATAVTTTKTKTPTTTATKKPTTTTTKKPTPTAKPTPESFLADQEKSTVVGSSADKNTWVYQLVSNSLTVREVVIDSGKGGAAVEVAQITDVHFTAVNDQDESNASTMSSYNQRKTTFWRSQSNIQRCMEFAKIFDQVVISGDTMDFLSYGNFAMIEQYIWGFSPNAMIALGNHDTVRVMGLPNDVKDTTTAASRYELVQKNWKHDIYYTSRVIGNKAMVIQLDNNRQPSDEMMTKLTNDIEKARKNGYTILLFMHEPLVSNNPSETDVEALANNRSGDNGYVMNFYGGNAYVYSDANKTKKWAADFFGGSNRSGNEKTMWELITTNADVIGGVFSGHWHANFYSEIIATTKSGTQKKIPQYVLAGAFRDNGHVMRITVK